MEACFLLLFSIVPVELTASEHFDLVELNHFYDDQGRKVFDQAIWYRWCYETERYQVVAWRLIKNDQPAYARDWEGGGYIATWNDGEVMRRVRADSFRETWTQYDPELSEREIYPKERRRELRKAEVK